MASTKVEFIDAEEAKTAVADVRSDATDIDWCLFVADSKDMNKLSLGGKGNNGVEGLKELLKADNVAYGLVRKTEKFDESITVKFAYIFWLGESIPRLQRAKISVLQGSIKEFIGAYHVDLTVSHADELSDAIVAQRISENTGTASRVINTETGQKEGVSSKNSPAAKSVQKSVSGGNLVFEDEATSKDAIADLRAGKLSWILLSYDPSDNNKVVLIGKGQDESLSVAPLVELLNHDIVGYGLVRKLEKIDNTEATKFAFIKYQGDNIPRMLRARLGTHMGAVTSFLTPFHVTLDATAVSEITDDHVMTLIKNASGTNVHVIPNKTPVFETTTTATTSAPSPSTTSTVKTWAPKSSNAVKPITVPKTLDSNQTIQLGDEGEIKDAIAAVRSDANSTNWCLVGFEGGKGNKIVFVAKGDGDVDELIAELKDDQVYYGLVRQTDKIDDSMTVKFVFVNWVGENINRMHRARLATYKGAVNNLFAPFHVDVSCEKLAEISKDIIKQKIQDASGSGSKVRNI